MSYGTGPPIMKSSRYRVREERPPRRLDLQQAAHGGSGRARAGR